MTLKQVLAAARREGIVLRVQRTDLGKRHFAKGEDGRWTVAVSPNRTAASPEDVPHQDGWNVTIASWGDQKAIDTVRLTNPSWERVETALRLVGGAIAEKLLFDLPTRPEESDHAE